MVANSAPAPKPVPRLTPSPRPAPINPSAPQPRATPTLDYAYIPLRQSLPYNAAVTFVGPDLWVQSFCLRTICQSNYESCVSKFDACACYPGLLQCANKWCWWSPAQSALHECHKTRAQNPSCRLECDLWDYPTESKRVEYKAVSSVRIQGTTADAFADAEYDFAQAVVAVVLNTPTNPSQVVFFNDILDVVDIDDRNGAPYSVLSVDFEVHVASNESMHSAQRALEADMLRGPGASILASMLVERGVLFNATQLSIVSALTAIDAIHDPFNWTLIVIVVAGLVLWGCVHVCCDDDAKKEDDGVAQVGETTSLTRSESA
ncbi:Aste57867_23 [Aphanomyces stellatus]|uniref:Aste57867_23 protein n=1 Tax=Aphanomyces stellatus TaxID=120398 RepID=A0A485K1R0_9STRA|nr:hypothetical protein As57867_000023 [Aphanomyces stellatus]VFT77249.1 Aste57867_23 [Aphanomyces stellatus]